MTAVAIAAALVITFDGGGSIDARAHEIATLARPVQIVGECYSACTMYLAAPDVCVSRGALLGFHGPHNGATGLGLSPAEFERASRVMADHLPATLQPWFLSVARYTVLDTLDVMGGELIDRFGVRECL